MWHSLFGVPLTCSIHTYSTIRYVGRASSRPGIDQLRRIKTHHASFSGPDISTPATSRQSCRLHSVVTPAWLDCLACVRRGLCWVSNDMVWPCRGCRHQCLTHRGAFTCSHFLHHAGSGGRRRLSALSVCAFRHRPCNTERLFFLLGFASVGAEHGHDCVLLELDILGVATRRLQLPRNTQVICPH